MSAGIDQDGTDYSYFIQVEMGSKKQKMYMLVDTGAGSSWVMGSSCTSNACAKHSTFGPDNSDTLNMTNDDFSIAYGTGQVKGKLATDALSVAGIVIDYKFGVASEASKDFETFAFDGILGLSMGKGASDNYMDTLSKSGKLSKNLFAVALNRASDGANNGEIRFGSVNKDKFTGDIKYTAVATTTGDWVVPMDDLGFDGKKPGAGALAYIDTGTSFIFGPKDLTKKLHADIPNAASSDGVVYTVPCDTSKSLTITFSGVDYQIPPKDYVSPKDSAGRCTSNVYGNEVVKGSWLVGDTFLKNVYSVFDRDNRQIGFANLGSGGSDQSQSVSSGPSSTTPTTGTVASGTAGSSSSSAASSGGSTTPQPPSPSSSSSSKPGMGLTGLESSKPPGTSTESTKPSKAADDKDSAAAGIHAGRVLYVVAFMASLVLLA